MTEAEQRIQAARATKATSLDLRRCELRSLPDLSGLESLKELYLIIKITFIYLKYSFFSISYKCFSRTFDPKQLHSLKNPSPSLK